MKRRQWYRLHKWIAVGSGAALLVWCASGLVMILPTVAPSISGLPAPQSVGPQPDYTTVTVSPAEAVQALEEAGTTTPVRNAILRRVGGRVAYEMRLEDNTRSLVDARTGQLFAIDSAGAVELARMASGSSAEVVGFAYVESPYNKYPYGEFPAYTVEFADAPSIAYTAAVSTGEVMRSSTTSRARVFMENTHTFRQMDRFVPGLVTHWTLVIFTILTGIAAAIGFWIAIPKSWLPVALGGARRSTGASSGAIDDPDVDYQGDR